MARRDILMIDRLNGRLSGTDTSRLVNNLLSLSFINPDETVRFNIIVRTSTIINTNWYYFFPLEEAEI